MSKARKFTITLTGMVPKGMTITQVRHAYWNGGFDGDCGPHYTARRVDIDEYYEDGRHRRPMVVRLGRARIAN